MSKVLSLNILLLVSLCLASLVSAANDPSPNCTELYPDSNVVDPIYAQAERDKNLCWLFKNKVEMQQENCRREYHAKQELGPLSAVCKEICCQCTIPLSEQAKKNKNRICTESRGVKKTYRNLRIYTADVCKEGANPNNGPFHKRPGPCQPDTTPAKESN